MDNFWWAMFAISMSLLATYIGYAANARLNHRRWLRETRLEIYRETIKAHGTYERAAEDVMSETETATKQIKDSRATYDAALDLVHESRRAFHKKYGIPPADYPDGLDNIPEHSLEDWKVHKQLELELSNSREVLKLATERINEAADRMSKLPDYIDDIAESMDTLQVVAPRPTLEAFRTYSELAHQIIDKNERFWVQDRDWVSAERSGILPPQETGNRSKSLDALKKERDQAWLIFTNRCRRDLRM